MKIFTASVDINNVGASNLPADLDSPSTLVMVFSSVLVAEFKRPLEHITAAFPQSTIVGCSTSGEIIGTDVEDGVIALAILQLENSAFRVIALPIPGIDASETLGRELAQRLDGPDLAGVMVLSDGFGVNGGALVAGIDQFFESPIPITGGLAGGDDPSLSWVVIDNESRSGWIVGVGFYGENIRIGHGSYGGWDAFGPQRLITKSLGTELFELDGKPALGIFKDYLGELAKGLPQTGLRFPLAIRAHVSDERYLIRTVLAINEQHNSMLFAGDVPTGWAAQLMSGNLERLIEGSAESARQAVASVDSTGLQLGIAVSCVGRRGVLRERAGEELEAAIDILGGNTQLVGFYSNGEISPHATGKSEFHNQTMTLITISEV